MIAGASQRQTPYKHMARPRPGALRDRSSAMPLFGFFWHGMRGCAAQTETAEESLAVPVLCLKTVQAFSPGIASGRTPSFRHVVSAGMADAASCMPCRRPAGAPPSPVRMFLRLLPGRHLPVPCPVRRLDGKHLYCTAWTRGGTSGASLAMRRTFLMVRIV